MVHKNTQSIDDKEVWKIGTPYQSLGPLKFIPDYSCSLNLCLVMKVGLIGLRVRVR